MLSAGCDWLSNESKANLADGRTAANLMAATRHDPMLSCADIRFAVSDGELTVAAVGLSRSQHTAFTAIARSTVGVERFDDNIGTDPVLNSRRVLHDVVAALSIKQQLRSKQLGGRVEIDVDGDEATVYGKVRDYKERRAIISIVKQDPELDKVTDRTRIVPEHMDDGTPWWERIDDRLVNTQVSLAIRLNRRLAPHKIQSVTTDATVVLRGTVSSDELAGLAVQTAQDVSGVKRVVNQLTVGDDNGS